MNFTLFVNFDNYYYIYINAYSKFLLNLEINKRQLLISRFLVPN